MSRRSQAHRRTALGRPASAAAGGWLVFAVYGL